MSSILSGLSSMYSRAKDFFTFNKVAITAAVGLGTYYGIPVLASCLDPKIACPPPQSFYDSFFGPECTPSKVCAQKATQFFITSAVSAAVTFGVRAIASRLFPQNTQPVHREQNNNDEFEDNLPFEIKINDYKDGPELIIAEEKKGSDTSVINIANNTGTGVVHEAKNEEPDFLASKKSFHDRDFRRIEDPKEVTRKLQTEMQAAEEQQKAQKSNEKFLTSASKRPFGTGKYFRKMQAGVYSDQGNRQQMEDNHLIESIEIHENTCNFFGVFDGHRNNKVSLYLHNHLSKFIGEEFNKLKELNDLQVWNTLKSAFVKLDGEIKKNKDLGGGSTAVTALQINGDLWIANTGDSRAILVKKNGEAKQLTSDQKPYDAKYEKSINKRTGIVLNNRVSGSLAVARSFGDEHYGTEHYAISARPKITKVTKEELQEWDYVILGCDGITDVASTNDIGNRLKNNLEKGNNNPLAIAEDITGASFAAGSWDNLTAIVVSLKTGNSNDVLEEKKVEDKGPTEVKKTKVEELSKKGDLFSANKKKKDKKRHSQLVSRSPRRPVVLRSKKTSDALVEEK